MTKLKIYKSCDSLSIYRFEKTIETGDLRFIVRGFDPEVSDVELSESESSELKDVFNDLMFEFTIASGSSNHEMKLKSQLSIKKLEISILSAEEVIRIYEEYKNVKVLNVINQVEGFSFNKSEDLNKQLKKIKRKISAKKTSLKIKTNNFTNKYKDKGKTSTIFEEAILISKALSLGYSINVKKTSCSEWVSFIKLCEKQNNNG